MKKQKFWDLVDLGNGKKVYVPGPDYRNYGKYTKSSFVNKELKSKSIKEGESFQVISKMDWMGIACCMYEQVGLSPDVPSNFWINEKLTFFRQEYEVELTALESEVLDWLSIRTGDPKPHIIKNEADKWEYNNKKRIIPRKKFMKMIAKFEKNNLIEIVYPINKGCMFLDFSDVKVKPRIDHE